jgi:hypothetical protein
MKTARIIKNIAVDVCDDPLNKFHPTISAQFQQVPEIVERGWVLDSSTGEWSSPPIQEPVLSPEVYTKLSPLDFKMCLTSAERIGIKAMVSTDVTIADFYEIIEDPRLTEVDMGLQSVRDAVGYIFAKLAESGVVASEDVALRVKQIVSGMRL